MGRMISKTLYHAIVIIVLIVLSLLGACCEYAKYQSVKKHFPSMTYTDYMFTEDKIRITNE